MARALGNILYVKLFKLAQLYIRCGEGLLVFFYRRRRGRQQLSFTEPDGGHGASVCVQASETLKDGG